MENYLNKITKEASNLIEDEKVKLVKLRIYERVGEQIDFTEESQRRFPRITKTIRDNDKSEHWYWNNGTKEGLILIIFYYNLETDLVNKHYKINFGFNYI